MDSRVQQWSHQPFSLEAPQPLTPQVPLVGILPYGVLKGRGYLESQACMSEQDHDVVRSEFPSFSGFEGLPVLRG